MVLRREVLGTKQMKKIAIVDYSIGNLFSVIQACHKVGLETFLTDKPEDLKAADGVILPGVGAFAQGMKNLEDKGLDVAIKEYVQTGKPLMGICLGFQLFLDESVEFESYKGLGLVKGKVRSLKDSPLVGSLPVPKITWDVNSPSKDWEMTPFQSVNENDDFYFVHSYYCDVEDKDAMLSTSKHGDLEYCSAILKDNVFATQFHPEKSAQLGLGIYEDWKKLFLM